MILTELMADGRIRHYSSEGEKIRQIETGNIYDDTLDYVPCRYTYEETDIPIEVVEEETEESAVEKLNILLGEEDNDGLHGDT